MGITDIFKNSNEKKLIDELKKYDSNKVQQDFLMCKRFERMRQTWNYENRKGLYYEIKKGKYITEQDIEDIKNNVDRNITGTNEFKFYIKILKGIIETQETSLEKEFVEMDEEIKVKKILMDFSDKLSENILKLKNLMVDLMKSYNDVLQKETMNYIDKVRKDYKQYNVYLEKIKQLFEVNNKKRNSDEFKKNYVATKNRLRMADEIQNWMYGENNFYQKDAQKVFNKYKKVYDLILKCKDEEKLKNYFQKLNSKKINVSQVYSFLAMIVVEAYGAESEYAKKFIKLQMCFN